MHGHHHGVFMLLRELLEYGDTLFGMFLLFVILSIPIGFIISLVNWLQGG